MRIQVAVPEAHVDKKVLDAALEPVTRLNERMLEAGEVVPFERGLKRGIKWAPEPPGQEHFDHAKTVLVRGWGDCDDLAPWHAASLRHSGEDPAAKAVVYKSGPQRWHAVVQRGDGQIDDPSLRAGMPGPKGTRGSRPAAVPKMPGLSGVNGAYIVRPQIAMRPVHGQFQARADIPWNWREHLELDKPSKTDWAMTTLHTAPVASTALVGAIRGALRLAETTPYADEDHLDRLGAIHDLLCGVDPEEIAEVYGEDHLQGAHATVVGFWGGLKNIVKKALPMVSRAVSFIPGVGPIASSALDLARTAIPSGGGSRPAPPAPAPAMAFAAPPNAVRTNVPGEFNRRICIPVSFM